VKGTEPAAPWGKRRSLENKARVQSKNGEKQARKPNPQKSQQNKTSSVQKTKRPLFAMKFDLGVSNMPGKKRKTPWVLGGISKNSPGGRQKRQQKTKQAQGKTPNAIYKLNRVKVQPGYQWVG